MAAPYDNVTPYGANWIDGQGNIYDSSGNFVGTKGTGVMASPSDLAAAQNLMGNPNVDWTSLLGPDYGNLQSQAAQNMLSQQYGYALTGPPAPGTPTLAGAQTSGMFQGNPILSAQEAAGVFGPNMGYLAGENTLAANEALGSINGKPTLSAQEAYGYSGGPSGTGTRTLGGQQLDYGTAMDAMKLLGTLQSNPFQMEAVARGIDSTGIPNALKGLMQGGAIPGFQAPQAKPQAPSLAGSLGIQNPAQGQGGGPATADPTSPYFDPAAAAGVNVDATNAAAPAPNKLNAVGYGTAAPTVQDFIKSLYQSMGYNPADLDAQMKSELPGFTAPRYGTVTA